MNLSKATKKKIKQINQPIYSVVEVFEALIIMCLMLLARSSATFINFTFDLTQLCSHLSGKEWQCQSFNYREEMTGGELITKIGSCLAIQIRDYVEIQYIKKHQIELSWLTQQDREDNCCLF